MSLAEELGALRSQLKALERENRQLKEENEFSAGKPLEKCVTDIIELKAEDGKLYVSAIFDCFDLPVVGLTMVDNMRSELCVSTVIDNIKNKASRDK